LISAGSLPQTTLGSLQRSPDLLAGFEGPTCKGRGGKGKGKKGVKGKGKEGRGRDGEESGTPRIYLNDATDPSTLYCGYLLNDDLQNIQCDVKSPTANAQLTGDNSSRSNRYSTLSSSLHI